MLPDNVSSAVIPQHVAVVLDGNGRWAKKRHLPRIVGHREGVKAVRNLVDNSLAHGLPYLTVFAFSSENWKRPQNEVNELMQLLLNTIDNEIEELTKANVRLRFIGDLSILNASLKEKIEYAHSATAAGAKMHVNIALNYGGRWEILEAARKLACSPLPPEDWTEENFTQATLFGHLPAPDLFIRTGGEQRVSNFLLWHIAYTEFYFTPVLWPDFNADDLNLALASFAERERRFGQVC